MLPTESTNDKPIPVSEIYGPVIQGEGMFTGKPVLFVRFGGCDYRCEWCDSLYAVDKKEHGKSWTRITCEGITKTLLRVSERTGVNTVVLSGGNPCIHDLYDLVTEEGLCFHVETQGTLAPDWLNFVQHLTVSPKPPSAGVSMEKSLEKFEAFYRSGVGPVSTREVKVVVDPDNEEDLAFALKVGKLPGTHARYTIQCVTPQGRGAGTVDATRESYAKLCAALEALDFYRILGANSRDIRVGVQQHVLIHGNKRGV